MIFEVSAGAAGITTHCGVLEFVAPDDRVYLPQWVREDAGCPRLCSVIPFSLRRVVRLDDDAAAFATGDGVGVRLVRLPKGHPCSVAANVTAICARHPKPKGNAFRLSCLSNENSGS